MKISVGDIIGTKDGRYGRVIFSISNQLFDVREMDSEGVEGEVFHTTLSNIASVV